MTRHHNERGQYRPIRTVLIDGPDYQQLPANARLMLLTLKLKLGPAGVGVINGLLHALNEHTGLSEAECEKALNALAFRGWIRYEKNVVWVIDGLKHEPSLSWRNAKHRGYVDAMVHGLPRLALVEVFCEYYKWWLQGDESLPVPELEPLAMELSELAPPPPMKTPAAPKAAKPKADSWVGEGTDWWEANVGAVGYPRFGKTLKPFVDRFTWERIFPCLQEYVKEMRDQGKTALRVEWFAAEAVARLERRSEEKRPLPSGVKPWEQEQYDSNLARQPHVAPTVEAYKKSRTDSEQWWMQMRREAKQKGRHALVYAYEWVLTHRRENGNGSAGSDRSPAPETARA